MSEQRPATSVPSIPLGSAPYGGPWTVGGAIGTAALIFGGSQGLGLLLLQGYIGWTAGWGRITDLGASEALPPATRLGLVVSFQLAVTALQLVLVWWIAGRNGRDRTEALSLRWAPLGIGGWIAAIALVFAIKIAATMLVSSFGKPANPREEMAPFLELARNNLLWLGFIVVAIVAALIEELIFRAILSRTLEGTRLGFWGGAAITSACFAVMHLQYGPAGQFVIFALGMAFSWLRARYDSIWPGVITHAVNNAVALVALKAIA